MEKFHWLWFKKCLRISVITVNAAVSPEQKNITIKIGDAEVKREKLKQKLSQVEKELESASAQISIYERLEDISEKLEQLHELGAGKLFWQEKYTTEDELLEHVKGLHTKAKAFNNEDRKSVV